MSGLDGLQPSVRAGDAVALDRTPQRLRHAFVAVGELAVEGGSPEFSHGVPPQYRRTGVRRVSMTSMTLVVRVGLPDRSIDGSWVPDLRTPASEVALRW